MTKSKISRVVVVAGSSLTLRGLNVNMQCGHFQKRIPIREWEL
jgi:hypothetical protein